jgi:hypothetical protein
MTNLNREFRMFYRQIHLSASQEKLISDLRQSLRKKIKLYFEQRLDLRPPKLFSRGRQASATSISPAFGEIVVQEGVLLLHIRRNSIAKWPEPEIVHLMMLNAIQDFTPDAPVDKMYSVCVKFNGLVRIEISILTRGPDTNMLAINGARGWQPDVQQHLAAWFKDQIKHQGVQLRRIARYLHAWADFHANRMEGFSRLLPLDILAALYFQADNERDDKSLAGTAAAIIAAAPCDFRWRSPFGGENTLPWFLSQQQNRRFIQLLEVLAEKGRLAVMTKDRMHACAIWRGLLGERFPVAGVTNPKSDAEVRGVPLNWGYFKGIHPVRLKASQERPWGHP